MESDIVSDFLALTETLLQIDNKTKSLCPKLEEIGFSYGYTALRGCYILLKRFASSSTTKTVRLRFGGSIPSSALLSRILKSF